MTDGHDDSGEGPPDDATDPGAGEEKSTPDAHRPAEETGGGGDVPLGDLAAEVRARRDDAGDGTDAFEAFTEMDVGDAGDVWSELGDGDGDGDAGDVEAAVGEATAELDPGDDLAGRDVHVVDKSLCHRCPHFAAPPRVECTHDGTEIREVVSADTFRVVDCPYAEDAPGEDAD